jgi:hypothetical protein
MSDWFFGLQMFPMALIVFGITYLLAACIFVMVVRLAVGERARVFKAIVPSCLSPLGAVFALLLVFSAEPVWTNFTHAKQAVAAEASGLRDALILARGMPPETEAHIRTLIGTYVAQSATIEWPAMASNRITIETNNVCGCSSELLTALEYMRGLKLQEDAQRRDQRDIIGALEKVRSARRERIVISEDDVSTSRFTAIVVIGLCLLIWVGLVHADNRKALGIAMTIFATVISMSTLLIVSYSSPFSGGHAVSPRILEEVTDGIPVRAAPTL